MIGRDARVMMRSVDGRSGAMSSLRMSRPGHGRQTGCVEGEGADVACICCSL